MRRLSSPNSKFTVQISSTAWKQMSRLPADSYRRIREELEFLAVLPSGDSPPPTHPTGEGSTRAPLSAVIGEYVVLYEVNVFLQLITVLEFARRLPHGE
jgi:mRNA-degrading endonuclease RelE of RelBE toxin-antitoxin system